jgi:hypothetical protein
MLYQWGGDHIIASNLCDQGRKNYVQIQVGTSTNGRLQNAHENVRGASTISYTIHVLCSTCMLYKSTSISYKSNSKCSTLETSTGYHLNYKCMSIVCLAKNVHALLVVLKYLY